ncbi:MAG: DUF188 domain-containing protein [Bacilli bacterium]|nr:DUF188 domain-containing protein [Bacilli bacterium]MDD4608200.1 DUF188 domain-containing protein [Bacilli bacterium]
MRILIDADACPSITEIEKIAQQHNIECLIFCDYNHHIYSDYSQVNIIDAGYQSVDMALINQVTKGDIVITQDYGLATLTLSKCGYAVSPNGMIFDEKNIDSLMAVRHIKAKIRSHTHLKGPRKRTKQDEINLIKSIVYLINK